MGAILINFSNSQSQPLATLTEEDRTVNQLLSKMASQEKDWHIVHNSFARVEDIIVDILTYQDTLSVFLFSGHAGRDRLLTTSGEANADGIAALLGQCPNLKLVVLNGCSTYDQVQGLLAAGVPCVIGTSAPVEDKRATQFSIAFFRALAESKKNIAKAFEEGLAAAKTISKVTISVQRDVVRRENTSDNNLPWHIVHPPGQDINLKWKLTPEVINYSFVPNELLLNKIWSAIAPFVNESGKEVNESDIRDKIITELPHPISEYLRKLIAKPRQGGENETFYNELNYSRLQYLIYTYTTCIELLTFTMLSQIWDELLHEKITELSTTLKDFIEKFFNLSNRDRRSYNIIPLIQEMGKYMADSNIEPFIKEYKHLEKIFAEEKDFYNACQNTEQVRINILSGDRISDDEAKPLCIQIEENLATIMGELGFLVKYKMASMKDIHFIKLKHQIQPAYRLNFVELKYRASGMDVINETRPDSIDNSSVVIMNKETSKVKYLNLSPFIFDENSFDERAKLASLCVFQSFEKAAQAFIFRYVYKPAERPLVIRNKTTNYFPAMADQLNTFYRLIFDKDLFTNKKD